MSFYNVKKACLEKIELRVKDLSRNCNNPEALALFCGYSLRPTISRLSSYYQDRSIFSDRPVIRIYKASESFDPDIYLFGWRCYDKTMEETEIHDHGNSAASVFVTQGKIKEVVYKPNNTIERTFSSGSLLLIPVGHVHSVSACKWGEYLSLTIHVYFPPLKTMTIFTKESSGKIKPASIWMDE